MRYRPQLQLFIKDYKELDHLEFSQERWLRLNQIRILLKPFEEHTKFVSREEPTLHRIPNLYLKLENDLKTIIKNDNKKYDSSLVVATQKGMEKFKIYYDAMKANDIYWIACILDPRVKSNWLKKNLIDSDEILIRINQFIKDSCLPDEELPESQREEFSRGFEDDFLQEYGSAVSTDDDIDRYFDLPGINFVLNNKENSTQWILNWWKDHKKEYPRMFRVARDYLVIPGSEVDVERLFNMARDVLGLRRMSMKAETLRSLILLKDHMRRELAGEA